MSHLKTGTQAAIGNGCHLMALGRVRSGQKDIGMRMVAHIDMPGSTEVQNHWIFIAVHARAVMQLIRQYDWDLNPLLLYPSGWGKEQYEKPTGVNCYHRVEFTRPVQASIRDDDSFLHATAQALCLAWKKTQHACLFKMAAANYVEYLIRPEDIELPTQGALNFYLKAETNSLATWLLRRAQQQGGWSPITFAEMHAQASPSDVILPQLLERGFVDEDKPNSRYFVAPALIDYAWRLSLNIPSAELG